MEDKKYKSAAEYAKDDITKALKSDPNNTDKPFDDRWNVVSNDIFTTKSRKLNKRLGLNNVNKIDKPSKRDKLKTFDEFKSK